MRRLNTCSGLIAIAVSVLISGAAQAGWHSGGGEMFTDAANPWFLENTGEVRYCIDIDEANFGQSLAVARGKITAAFAYWRGEFSSVAPPIIGPRNTPVRIATQAFTEVDCSQAVDLTFQLGTLNDEQAAYLKHPEKVVAEAVRTDYDPVQLRGKGFVYVSPETGRYALTGPGAFDGPLIPERWRYAGGALLEIVLVHELGHIFGLPHVEDTHMAASAPALFVTAPFGYGVFPDSGAPNFFMRQMGGIYESHFYYDYGPNGISPEDKATELLSLPADTRRLDLRPDSLGRTLELYATDKAGGAASLIGRFTGDGSASASSSSLLSLYLTPAQKVFEFTGTGGAGDVIPLFYPMSAAQTLKYQPVGGDVVRHVAVQATGANINFIAVDSQGRISLDVFDMSSWTYDITRGMPERRQHQRLRHLFQRH